MPKTIKFRGKTKMPLEELNDIHVEHEDGWFYGHLVMYGNTPYIVGDFIEVDQDYTINEFWVPVYPESVGQYTCLQDKNGKEIYEGDILKLVLVDWSDVQEDIFTVSSDNFVEDVCYLKAIVSHAKDVESETDSIEVIGNIYEHKHLLEERQHV